MNLKNLINTVSSYKKAYRNYISVLFMLLIKREASLHKNIKIKVLLKDKEWLTVPYGWVTAYVRLRDMQNINISDLKLTKNGLSLKYKDLPVIIDPARFSDPDAVFFREDYKFLNVKNRDVIDIGMNIGDSSIYFSINGAKRVIGLEPYPYTFSFAENNVKLNGINNIILLNAGYGKDSNVIVEEEKIFGIGASLISSVKGKSIPIFSLKTLINKYNIKNGVLKMDCEGCKYALLDEDDEVFNNIEMIEMEYHYGYEDLVKKLKECGFDVKYTEPRKTYNPEAENSNMYVGHIYAKNNLNIH
jgi:FkbM family methyltransferase